MSVRADLRSESSLLFYKIARELRREISCDLLNKFNSKNETFTTEENTVVNQNEQYPAYMVDFIRKDILGLLQKLMQYISIANSIYPACVLEVDKRRLLQDYAIGTAEALQNELEYCADVFPETLRCLLHYADEIDHLIKVLRRWKKSNAKILKKYKIRLNPKKTRITPIKHGVDFLHCRYKFGRTGKIIKSGGRESVKRERRKLKKFRKKLDEGELDRKQIAEFYSSWRGFMQYFDSKILLKNTDKLYNKLFIEG